MSTRICSTCDAGDPTNSEPCNCPKPAPMRLPEAIKILQINTMACWWPCAATGKQGTDIGGIIGEVDVLLSGIKGRQGVLSGEMFYYLDEANPETALYDQLVSAVQVLRRSVQC